jgi:hypothetical protein
MDMSQISENLVQHVDLNSTWVPVVISLSILLYSSNDNLQQIYLMEFGIRSCYCMSSSCCALCLHCAAETKLDLMKTWIWTQQITVAPQCGVTGIFLWHNHSGRTMALGLTRPLTGMSTRNISWRGGGGWPVRSADNLTTFMCCLSWNLGVSASWNPQGLFRPVMGLIFTYRMCHGT